MMLYMIWIVVFSFEVSVLLSISFSWYHWVASICCIFSAVVLVGFSDYLKSNCFKTRKVR